MNCGGLILDLIERAFLFQARNTHNWLHKNTQIQRKFDTQNVKSNNTHESIEYKMYDAQTVKDVYYEGSGRFK